MHDKANDGYFQYQIIDYLISTGFWFFVMKKKEIYYCKTTVSICKILKSKAIILWVLPNVLIFRVTTLIGLTDFKNMAGEVGAFIKVHLAANPQAGVFDGSYRTSCNFGYFFVA